MADKTDGQYEFGAIVLLTDGTRAKVIDHGPEIGRCRIEQAGAQRVVDATEITGRADAWACVAYGRLPAFACFFSETGRVCSSHEECETSVAFERQRVWSRIEEGAAAGDPLMVAMSREITGPDGIFGGPSS